MTWPCRSAANQRKPFNDQVIILIGTLPPVDFLLDMGLELDGIWSAKRVIYSGLGILAGIFVYFLPTIFPFIQTKREGLVSALGRRSRQWSRAAALHLVSGCHRRTRCVAAPVGPRAIEQKPFPPGDWPCCACPQRADCSHWAR